MPFKKGHSLENLKVTFFTVIIFSRLKNLCEKIISRKVDKHVWQDS